MWCLLTAFIANYITPTPHKSANKRAVEIGKKQKQKKKREKKLHAMTNTRPERAFFTNETVAYVCVCMCANKGDGLHVGRRNNGNSGEGEGE